MNSGAFPVQADEDPLVASLRLALASIEVVGPDANGAVLLRLTATWGAQIDQALGRAGESEAADAWLAWRDLLA